MLDCNIQRCRRPVILSRPHPIPANWDKRIFSDGFSTTANNSARLELNLSQNHPIHRPNTRANSARTTRTNHPLANATEFAYCIITKMTAEWNSIPLSMGDVVIAVMGPTGTGKSTFVRTASGNESVVIGLPSS